MPTLACIFNIAAKYVHPEIEQFIVSHQYKTHFAYL